MSSQDYHQAGIFGFSNGFERSTGMSHQEHLAQQIRRDKLRVQGFEPPAAQPLVGMEEEGSSNAIHVYETEGILSEMFNFPSGVAAVGPTELLDQHVVQPNYRAHRPPGDNTNEWFSKRQGVIGGLGLVGESKSHDNRDTLSAQHQQHHQQQQLPISINTDDSAAAMKFFLMNPHPRRSPPSPPPPSSSSSNTLHMLLPNPSASLQGFNVSGPGGASFDSSTVGVWVPNTAHEGDNTGSQVGGVIEGQGLSLSLSSSLQQLEAAGQFHYKTLGSHHHHHQQPLHLQGGVGENHQVHAGFGSSLMVNVLRNSRYLKAAQELLEEFCSVGRGQVSKKKKFGKNNPNPNSNPGSNGGGGGGGGGGGSSSSTKDPLPLSAADRIEHQRRKVKLLSMLDEVDRRYNHYCEQMQTVVNSFDLAMGFGAAVPYTALAKKAMSRHFKCLKDAISAQLKHSCELLGDKDGNSGITKGETPRLRMLEQSFRQQRMFHQMGMMEQEAWRPQRGLPDRSVSILRAWLFEHFLHPYPSDADKLLLARQTGLSKNQVSNWFINARVRLWKPMVEDMYQQEIKDVDEDDDDDNINNKDNTFNSNNNAARTSTPSSSAAAAATPSEPPPTTTTAPAAAGGKRSEINAMENDPSSLIAINTQCFSENQATHHHNTTIITTTPSGPTPHPPHPTTTTFKGAAAAEVAPPPVSDGGSTVSADYGTTLIRFGTTTSGDVSLTLGLRHPGNMPEAVDFQTYIP